MISLRGVLTPIWRIALAAAISFCFFVAVSMLHSMINFGGKDSKKSANAMQLLTEVHTTPPPPPRSTQRLIRQVRSTESGKKGGPSQASVRFTPDLSLDIADANGQGVAVQKQDLGIEVFEEGQTDESATPVYMPQIPYPERARDLGVEGDLEVVFVIDHTGKPTTIDVVRSPHPLLSAEARKAIATWRFKPAKNKGIPVNVRVRQVITFKLDQ